MNGIKGNVTKEEEYSFMNKSVRNITNILHYLRLVKPVKFIKNN